MTEQWFEPKGLFYKTNSLQPGRKTIVFVHGLTGSSSAWIDYEAKFSAEYNILSFDLRGHGKSKKFKRYRDYAIDNFSEDLHDLVQALHLTDIILVSHSYGTFVAFDFLRKYQALVSATIFLSPLVNTNESWGLRLIKPVFKASQTLSIFPARFKTGYQVDYRRFPNTGDYNLHRMWVDTTNTTLRITLYCISQSYAMQLTPVINQLTIPCLILHGEKDHIFTVKHSYDLAKKIPQATLMVFPQSNHILVLNDFTVVSQAIAKFLQTLK